MIIQRSARSLSSFSRSLRWATATSPVGVGDRPPVGRKVTTIYRREALHWLPKIPRLHGWFEGGREGQSRDHLCPLRATAAAGRTDKRRNR